MVGVKFSEFPSIAAYTNPFMLTVSLLAFPASSSGSQSVDK